VRLSRTNADRWTTRKTARNATRYVATERIKNCSRLRINDAHSRGISGLSRNECVSSGPYPQDCRAARFASSSDSLSASLMVAVLSPLLVPTTPANSRCGKWPFIRLMRCPTRSADKRSKTIAMRATSQNQLAAYYMGIPVKMIFSLIWAISAGVATAAGVLLAPVTLIDEHGPCRGAQGVRRRGDGRFRLDPRRARWWHHHRPDRALLARQPA
jgi:hypothetical protein